MRRHHWYDYGGSPTPTDPYTVLNYLQSTSGSPYINTGKYANQNTKVEIKFNITSDPTKVAMVFGNDGPAFWIASKKSGSMYNRYVCRDSTTRVVLETTRQYGVDYTVIFNDANHDVYENGVLIGNLGSTAFTCSNSMFLFGDHTSKVIEWYSYCKIYYCKIWQNGTLVSDLVPRMRNSDSTYGFLNLVDDSFLTKSGSGTITGA